MLYFITRHLKGLDPLLRDFPRTEDSILIEMSRLGRSIIAEIKVEAELDLLRKRFEVS